MADTRKLYPALCFALGVLAAQIAMAESKMLRVFAAASLTDAVSAALEDWPHPWVLSAAGSGTIARQIDQGAPADVVMLANPDWMDWLAARGHLVAGTQTAPIGNQLVLVGPSGAPALQSLTRAGVEKRLGIDGRLAMGEHRSVPAGIYAKQWLERVELWDAMTSRLAEVENVRAALALVSRAEVPLALIYRSDLAAAPDAAQIVWDIPDQQQPDIRYSIAAVTEYGRAAAVHLSSAEAVGIYRTFGFTVLTR